MASGPFLSPPFVPQCLCPLIVRRNPNKRRLLGRFRFYVWLFYIVYSKIILRSMNINISNFQSVTVGEGPRPFLDYHTLRDMMARRSCAFDNLPPVYSGSSRGQERAHVPCRVGDR